MARVDDLKTVLHQRATQAPPLEGCVNAKPWEIPMGKRGMGGVHLFNKGERVIVLVW